MESDYLKELYNTDNIIHDLIKEELVRQQKTISLIAAENIVSKAVLDCLGSVLTNKDAEGYPEKRYHAGCEVIDKIEEIAIERAKSLFKAKYANVQPHSATQANQAAIFSLVDKGDIILAMKLDHGGHISVSDISIAGEFLDFKYYGVDPDTKLLDYDHVRKISRKIKPKIIVAGYSSYPRKIDFERFREIADEIGAYLMADVAHIAGLVAADLHPSSIDQAHITTTSTYKTLRGPRGGIILSGDYAFTPIHKNDKSEILYKLIEKSVFPLLQSPPHPNLIAAKAVCLYEAMQPEFKEYQKHIINNAKTLAESLKNYGFDIVTGGTDNHIVLIDLTKAKGKNNNYITGKIAEDALSEAGLITNRNLIPYDTRNSYITSGLRLGTPSVTTRGMKEHEMKIISDIIYDTLRNIEPLDEINYNLDTKSKCLLKEKVGELAKKFLIYN